MENQNTDLEKYCNTIKNYNLINLNNILKKYGNFQNSIKIINVVGTNGKGSTTSFLVKQLMLNNKKVGSFLSPTFLCQNERVQINNQNITDEKIWEYIEYFKKDLTNDKYKLTFFELWTLIGMKYFYDNKVDVAVIEAGLGGRLDSTKLYKNQLAICLTSISKDHTNVLGKKIRNIIDEKVKIRWDNKTKIFTSSSNAKYKSILKQYQNVIIAKKYNKTNNIFQKDNVGNVISVLKYLNLKIHSEFFQESPILGRFTILKSKPKIIIDGAHNYDAINMLVNNIKKKQIKNPIIYYASSNDKNYHKILTLLEKEFKLENIILSNFNNLRTWDIFNDKNLKKYKKYNIKELINHISLNKNNNIIFTGSIYFISEIYQILLKYNIVDKKL